MELVDRVTGQGREVDVVIEVDVHGHHVVVGIECVDHQRPAGVPWVDQMVEKHCDLPTDKLVLVSASGFTKTAIRKARAKGVDTETLGELEDQPWTKIVGKREELLLESIRGLVGVGVFESPKDEWPGTRLCLDDKLMRGDLSIVVDRFVDAVLSKRELMEVALRVAREDEADASSIFFEPSPGMSVITVEGSTIDVHDLFVVISPSVTRDTVRLESGLLRGAPVAYGGVRGPGGRELDIAVIESEEGGAEISFTERMPGRAPLQGSLSDLLIAGLQPATDAEVRRLLGRE